MAIKRKAVSIVSKALAKRAKEEAEPEVEEQDGEEAPKVLKRPAAARASGGDAAPTEDAEADDAEEEEDEAEEEVSEEQKLKEQEEREAARRTKELKGTPAAELKDLVAGLGLEVGNKADMIQQVVAHEAKMRADAREREAKLRAVVVKKKEELEATSLSDLSKLCAAAGIKGPVSKQDRIQHLLKKWQEEDGVDKALRQMAQDERRKSLEAMDKSSLRDLCEQAGLEPFVTEVMADRIGKREHEMGCYLRPEASQAGKAAAGKEGGDDMVTALLEGEKNRKKDKEERRRQEEAAASKRKELRGMTVDDLKKALAKRGVEATGKKEEMVETLFGFAAQEEAVAARKSELKALSVQELKELVANKGLEASGKDKMVDALIAYEAKLREELRAFDAKAVEVLAQRKEELEGKTATELKESCESKGLKVGGGKEEKIERLLEDAQKSGEVHDAVAKLARKARREALGAVPRDELVALCAKVGADPLVKEVIVERILAHEAEHGAIEPEAPVPAAKRAKTGKK